jgi:hypothetical protein
MMRLHSRKFFKAPDIFPRSNQIANDSGQKNDDPESSLFQHVCFSFRYINDGSPCASGMPPGTNREYL